MITAPIPAPSNLKGRPALRLHWLHFKRAPALGGLAFRLGIGGHWWCQNNFLKFYFNFRECPPVRLANSCALSLFLRRPHRRALSDKFGRKKLLILSAFLSPHVPRHASRLISPFLFSGASSVACHRPWPRISRRCISPRSPPRSCVAGSWRSTAHHRHRRARPQVVNWYLGRNLLPAPRSNHLRSWFGPDILALDVRPSPAAPALIFFLGMFFVP